MNKSEPPLPTFLIVGAMKSGTSTLAAHLRQHPDIFMPRKEVHFFNKNPAPEENLHEYRSFFSGWSGEHEVGEKTPNYSLTPRCPGLISKTLPDVKIIWCFRDPVERTYSNYWHSVKRGWELRSFDAAIRREMRIEKSGKKTRLTGLYAHRSQYVEQIERFLEYFENNRMHSLLLEDLKSEPERTLKGVLKFLGVEQRIATPPDLHAHQTHLPRSPLLQYIARRILGDSAAFKKVAWLNRRTTPGYPMMSRSSRIRLSNKFRQWYPEFERLTGLSTRKWPSARID